MPFGNTKIVLLGAILTNSPIRAMLQGLAFLDAEIKKSASQNIADQLKVLHETGKYALIGWGIPEKLIFGDQFYEQVLEKAQMPSAAFLDYDEKNCDYASLFGKAAELDKVG